MYVFIIDVLVLHNPIQVAGTQHRDPQFPKVTALPTATAKTLDWLYSPRSRTQPDWFHMLVCTFQSPPTLAPPTSLPTGNH